MRPRLKSLVDQGYHHHRFMTYWAQSDGGWFSLTRKNVLDSSLGGERPVSTGASISPELSRPPRGLKVNFLHDERHHFSRRSRSNEICFESTSPVWRWQWKSSHLLCLSSSFINGKTPVYIKCRMEPSPVIAAGEVGCSALPAVHMGEVCLRVVQMERWISKHSKGMCVYRSTGEREKPEVGSV